MRGLALAGGAVVLAGQAVLTVWALRAWSLLWASGPDSPFRGPGFAQSELAPSAVVQTALPYILGVIGASVVMLVGASIVGLAVWKSSGREKPPAPAEASVTSST